MTTTKGWTSPPHPEATRTDWEWDNPIYRTLNPEHYANPHNYGTAILCDWADHRDKWVVNGVPTYSCHPYQLFGDALDDFVTLRAAGWRVYITGSEYYPGRTVQVDITPPEYLCSPRRKSN